MGVPFQFATLEMEIEMDCSVSKISGLIIETELPLLKIETKIILSLFCWNLKPIRNEVSVAIYKIAIFTPKIFQ